MRIYGIQNLQTLIRNHVALSLRFKQYVERDKRFELCNDVKMGLVCFRLKGSDGLNDKLLSIINKSGKLYLSQARIDEKLVIRFCVCHQHASEDDIDFAWNTISELAAELLVTIRLWPKKIIISSR